MLTIAISTNSVNYNIMISDLLENGPAYQSLNISVIVFVQSVTPIYIELPPWIDVHHESSTGLSKSRNAVIRLCRTKWLWFQDDDLIIDFGELKRLVFFLESYAGDLVFVKIRSAEDGSVYYKNYSFHNKTSQLNCNKISSIEIIGRADFFRDKGLLFNEQLGLGSPLPCCEENLFIWDCFKSFARVVYLNCSPCLHTLLVKDRYKNSYRHYLARGYYLRYLPLYFAIPLMVRWGVRSRIDVGMCSGFRGLIIGFFSHKPD